jgi:mono/diheme cytochrome c family protein
MTGAGCWLAASPALADYTAPRVPPLPTYTQECAACHVAYPAGMLPAASWQRLMGTLNKHYGTDASLDEASVREISTWLKANAGTYRKVREEPPQDRITQAAWFVREHRKVDPEVWKHTSVKSAANCAACHTKAEQGDYSERNIAYPAGLDAKYRRGWKD